MASTGIFRHSTNCEGSGAVAMRDITACTRDAGVVIRRLRRSDRPLLLGMYDAFVPLGAALGLPPRSIADQRTWLCALDGAVNLGAFAEGRLIGHLALLPVGTSTELAVFVHQDFRRRGVATALINDRNRYPRRLYRDPRSR